MGCLILSFGVSGWRGGGAGRGRLLRDEAGGGGGLPLPQGQRLQRAPQPLRRGRAAAPRMERLEDSGTVVHLRCAARAGGPLGSAGGQGRRPFPRAVAVWIHSPPLCSLRRPVGGGGGRDGRCQGPGEGGKLGGGVHPWAEHEDQRLVR